MVLEHPVIALLVNTTFIQCLYTTSTATTTCTNKPIPNDKPIVNSPAYHFVLQIMNNYVLQVLNLYCGVNWLH